MKEKFIYVLKEDYYRIRIVRENPKFRYDERINCTLEKAIILRDKILTEHNIELNIENKNTNLIEFKKTSIPKGKIKLKKRSDIKVDKYIYKLANKKYRVLIKKGSKGYPSYVYYSIGGISNLKKAKEIRNIKLAELTLLKDKIKYNDSITFYEFVEYWYDNYCKKELSPTTLTGVKNSLNNYVLPIFASKKLSEISAKDLQMFFSELKARKKRNSNVCGENECLSLVTVNGVYRLLRNILNKAVYWEYIITNPIYKVNPIVFRPKEQLIYTKNELFEILKLLKKENLFVQTIFTLLICSGIRRSELVGLFYNGINFTDNNISIKRNAVWDSEQKIMINKQTKTESSVRIIPLPGFCIDLLKKYTESEGIHHIENNIFLTKDDKIINSNRITCLWKEFRNKNNLKNVTVHGIRHSYCSLQVNNNSELSIADVSKLMGHSQISTTFRYTHANFGKENDTISIFEEK